MHMTNLFRRPSTAALALSLCAVLPLASAPSSAREIERGVEPVHQPVVERTDFVLDVIADGNGSLGASEQSRLTAWFKALDLRYGDHVSISNAQAYGQAALYNSIASVVGRYGLLIEGDAPVTAGEAPAGGVRIVVSRSMASVPGCPSWRDHSMTDFTGGASDNYGCASATNLAAMIADPRDLVEGRGSGLDPKNVVSGRAIKAYTEKPPTGAGGLPTASTGAK
jgi:pilus assembly protein CpaD